MRSMMNDGRLARRTAVTGGLIGLVAAMSAVVALVSGIGPLSARSAAERTMSAPTRHSAPAHARHASPVPAPVAALPVAPPGAHLMVDTASAPSLHTVRAWQRRSPYRAIGVYIHVSPSVDDRHDKVQRHLTADWVARVRAGGWNVLPIYLGAQAPQRCVAGPFHTISDDAVRAQRQGVTAAEDAARSVAALRLPTNVPVMYDMEYYHAGCSEAIQSFVLGWTARLHQLGRLAGVYGPPSSLGQDLLRAGRGAYAQPDVLWAVTADGSASTAVRGIPAPAWHGRRANQFALDVHRTYGGRRLAVDDSSVDDGVWAVQRPHGPDTTAPVLTLAAAPGAIEQAASALRWSAIDEVSTGVSYQLRVRRARAGAVIGGWSAPAPVGARLTARMHRGDQVCVRVRARDAAGNASGWSPRRCTSRLADDRAARRGRGFRHARVHGAYRGTVTTAAHRHAVLHLGRSARGSLGIVVRGRGSLVVRVAGHRVGRVEAGGLRWIRLRHAGAVSVITTSHRRISVDGFVLTPR